MRVHADLQSEFNSDVKLSVYMFSFMLKTTFFSTHWVYKRFMKALLLNSLWLSHIFILCFAGDYYHLSKFTNTVYESLHWFTDWI